VIKEVENNMDVMGKENILSILLFIYLFFLNKFHEAQIDFLKYKLNNLLQ
jgi:hypothetical protein